MTSISIGLGVTLGGRPAVSYDGPQIVIIGYGQSNWLNHVGTSSSPPAADADTYYWNDTEWEAASTGFTGNGARALLNLIASTTGKTVGLISGGQSGVNIAALQPGAGTGYFETLSDRITDSNAAGAEAVYIVFHQGEGDADSAGPPSPATYSANMDTLHGNIVNVLGKTRAQCPFICSSLANWVPGIATDSSWNNILNAQYTAHNTYPNIYYSHSNRPATVDGDGAHWDTAAFYEKSGSEYARTILWIRDDVATRPNWNIASAAIVDATHTDVTLTHSMGTDFTPTTGITGFEVSIDGFATPVTPSAAVRQSATVIRLTHSSLTTTANRQVRYQYGLYPTVTDPVLDNSSLAVPLNHTAGQSIVAAGSSPGPVLTHITAGLMNDSLGEIQTLSSLDLSPNDVAKSYIITVAHPHNGAGGAVASTVTITPNGGSPISGALLYRPAAGTAPLAEFWRVVVPAGTPGMDDADITVTMGVNPFTRSGVAIAGVTDADVSSWTPVDTDTSTVTGTARTLDISTSADGFYIAVAGSTYNAGATSCTWTGDQPPLEAQDFTSGFGANFSTAIANFNSAQTNANTITATYANSGDMRLTAISIR